MTPELLEHFLVVCKYQNISRAADVLFLDNSSLGRQIAKLEDYFGTALFIRNNRNVELTPAGRELAEAAPKLLKVITDVKKRVRIASQEESATLSISAINVVYKPLFALYELFKQAHPNTVLHFRNVAPGDVPEYVLNDSTDLGVESSTVLDGYSNNFETLVIDRMQFCVIVNSNHRLASRETVRLEELYDEQFVVMEHEPPEKFLQALRGHDVILQKLATSSFGATTWQDMILQVIAGTGVALIPGLMAKSYPGCTILDIEDELAQPSVLLFWKPENKNPELQKFLEIARKNL